MRELDGVGGWVGAYLRRGSKAIDGPSNFDTDSQTIQTDCGAPILSPSRSVFGTIECWSCFDNPQRVIYSPCVK